MELVGQMYKLSACFDTPNEYKGLPYDYFPEDAVTYGSTICSFGLPYNDHNYGMPTGLTPPVMAPHLMDPVPKPKKTAVHIKSESTDPCPPRGALSPSSSTSTTCRSSDSTPRKAYMVDEAEYPVYVEPEIKVVEVPDNLCVSASEYSDASSESSSEDTRVNPEFLFYLRSLANRHESIERYLERAHRHYEQYAPSQKSSGSEKKEAADFVIDCVCEYNYDDRRMVQCESCGIRQHLDCMYANPRQIGNFLKHKCHNCSDIKVDISRAKTIQSSRKNWHLTAQYSEKWHQRSSRPKTEEGVGGGASASKRHRDGTSKANDHRSEQAATDGSKGGTMSGTSVHRVNKRKQDLKAYGAEVEKCSLEEAETLAAAATRISEGPTEESVEPVPVSDVSEPQQPQEAVDPRAHLSDMYQEHGHASEDEDDRQRPVATAMFSSIGEDYTERLALLSRRPQSFKKDYKEASRSLYTDRLLARVREAGGATEEPPPTPGVAPGTGPASEGPEFLDRNPRCRIVLFDGCTIGLEASVRLQGGSIVCALIGRMMLMEEYLKYTNPATEHKQFVFLYHNFPENGLVIDTTVYGNIVRYLRRSCDPNVKLEHTIIGGNLYIVVRTTTDICQGVELTIPFDLPFEICQYPVQCACGKVRCPAVKHRRKHHRNRIITTSINCEQVIEDKLRELSQPLCGAPSTYATPSKKPSMLLNRFPGSSYHHGRTVSDLLDVKPPLSSLARISGGEHSRPYHQTQAAIKIEEVEPPEEVATDQEEEQPPLSKQISSELCGSAILTTKRRPKPVLHPDFEMDPSPGRLLHGEARSRGSQPATPVKACPAKAEPSLKRVRTSSGSATDPATGTTKTTAKDVSEFKSIITTRRQKRGKSPSEGPGTTAVKKTEPIVVCEETVSPRRRPPRR